MPIDDLVNLKIAAKVLCRAADNLMDYSDRCCDFDSEIGRSAGVEINELAAQAFDLYEKISRIVEGS